MIIDKNIKSHAGLFFDLGAQKRPLIISLVGAGGKTSTLFWLARLFHGYGRRVIVTTTTHMFLPDAACPTIFCREPAALPSHYLMRPIWACFRAWKAQEGKARGFSPQAIDALAARAECDVILVEADGAHGLPLKAPDEHEPCIPESSCCVIAVMGGQMLGENTGAENVHRWPLFAEITGLTADEPLTFGHLLRLIRHPQGAFKNVPPDSRRIWFLNQFSQSENSATEYDLFQLLRNGNVDAIWLGAVREQPPITRRLVR
ncbi:putative selenium-dependent hydroxylase accessory protein YqeC [Klebsiella indica]|uniref:Putative selenium-dependent hydroxylase accessory protein YqeC n=1 Tax=Klebsiella indica TaxID=2582917 RepID=A0A5R9LI99_9ENTR|nr:MULTISPECIES: selenium cofactor biosynthesis protein YqeC [Klebsiella]TLV18301.1 putative selenium-dependent hydroxylase accessory protein YqeC [Klebsiella indica]